MCVKQPLSATGEKDRQGSEGMQQELQELPAGALMSPAHVLRPLRRSAAKPLHRAGSSQDSPGSVHNTNQNHMVFK